MRRIILGLTVLFLFGSSSAFSNPYVLTLINEVQSSPDSLEAIELHWTPEPLDFENMDIGGWFITTSAGTAYINPSVILPESGYVVINPENTIGEFSLNDSFETIKIYSPDEGFPIDSISVFFPPEGQSAALCDEFVVNPDDPGFLYQVIYFYWDSSPTMGYENDDQHSCGTIEGRVLDGDSQPISEALITALFRNYGWIAPDSVVTDSDGQFEFDKLTPGPYRLTAQIDTLSDTLWVDLFSNETTETEFTFPQLGIRDRQSSLALPKRVFLFPNYPNPFNSSTQIRYFLPEGSSVRLTIYNILGQKVATLIDGFQKAGYKSLSWKPKGLLSGVYFCRVQAQGEEATKRMILLR